MKLTLLFGIFLASWAGATEPFSLDGMWKLAKDGGNVGLSQNWQNAPVAQAIDGHVPGVFQLVFPDHQGLVWYWREFEAPRRTLTGSHFLLKFERVDYACKVWLNGKLIGENDEGEMPFSFDVTDILKPGEKNKIAVRVLNPTDKRIDNLVLSEVPACNKTVKFVSGHAFNYGGIVRPVTLVEVHDIYVADFHIVTKNDGTIHAEAILQNTRDDEIETSLVFNYGDGRNGETFGTISKRQKLAAGRTVVSFDAKLTHPRLWQLEDPYLYRGSITVNDSLTRSERFGFREFVFKNGYFRLNGKRIYLKSTHIGNNYPAGFQFPVDPDLYRRSLLNLKAMGFNMIRFIWGNEVREQLDFCDEIGLMVYEEGNASECFLTPSPDLPRRLRDNVTRTILRDRNHPSIVIWGLMNEVRARQPSFVPLANMLPELLTFDSSRMFFLNGGRWDLWEKKVPKDTPPRGSLANPGVNHWEDVLQDDHNHYLDFPHPAHLIEDLKTTRGNIPTQPLFLSEYGLGSAMDLMRTVRYLDQIGYPNTMDTKVYRLWKDRYLADWVRWKLREVFDTPDDYFRQSIGRAASFRIMGLTAIRANPAIIGHNVTGAHDHGMTGEGLTTPIYEFKPGIVETMKELWAPLRWNVFAEPAYALSGVKTRLQAVLSDEDALRPGNYPATAQVFDSHGRCLWKKTFAVKIPKPNGKERPFAKTYLDEQVVLDGGTDHYRFLVEFDSGAAAAGREAEFYRMSSAEMPSIEKPVCVWGDVALGQWLMAHSIPCAEQSDVIFIGRVADKPEELYKKVSGGATVVFLTPSVFSKNVPLTTKFLAPYGSFESFRNWLYHSDDWNKPHPFFDGLPNRGLLDARYYYREIISNVRFLEKQPAAEAVAGSIFASRDYSSGLTLAVYRCGKGRIVFNTLRLLENLNDAPDRNPVAERLVRNIARAMECAHPY